MCIKCNTTGKEAQKSQYFLFLWLKIFTYFITNIIIFNYNNFALKHIFTNNCQILHKIPENEKDTNICICLIFFFKKCITLRKFFFFFFTFSVTRVLIPSIFIIMFISHHYFSVIIIFILFS